MRKCFSAVKVCFCAVSAIFKNFWGAAVVFSKASLRLSGEIKKKQTTIFVQVQVEDMPSTIQLTAYVRSDLSSRYLFPF